MHQLGEAESIKPGTRILVPGLMLFGISELV
jgi:hypothetical protein